MIVVKIEKNENLLHFIYSGKVTHEDYQKVVIPTVEKEVAKGKPIRAFYDLRDMKSIQTQAVWDDYKVGMRYIKNFDRLATVGDQWWVAFFMKISQPFFKMKLKHFKSQQYDKAWEWVKKK